MMQNIATASFLLQMSENNKCCMCQVNKICPGFLTPSDCLISHGLEKSHKICQSCWWSDFAIEESTHKCPGCSKKLDFPKKTK